MHKIYVYIYIFIYYKEHIPRQIKRSNRDFNGNTSINTMLVIEINGINPKSLQASLTCCSHIFWKATNLGFPISILSSKFGCQLNPFSHYSLQGLTHKSKTNLHAWSQNQTRNNRSWGKTIQSSDSFPKQISNPLGQKCQKNFLLSMHTINHIV